MKNFLQTLLLLSSLLATILTSEIWLVGTAWIGIILIELTWKGN